MRRGCGGADERMFRNDLTLRITLPVYQRRLIVNGTLFHQMMSRACIGKDKNHCKEMKLFGRGGDIGKHMGIKIIFDIRGSHLAIQCFHVDRLASHL